MGKTRVRYLYRRERADGSANETTSQRTFEKWLKDYADGDEFYVAHCRWGQVTQDGTVAFGGGEIPHVKLIKEVGAKEN